MATPNEGIALLSMYNDEEDDEDEEPEPEPQQQQQHKDDDNDDNDDDDDYSKTLIHQNSNDISGSIYPHQQDLRSPSPEIKSLRSPTPPPWSKSLQASSTSSPLNLASYVQSSPLPPLPPRRGGGGGGGGLAIVDYAHDEAAMSPEAESEEGEIVRSAGRVVVMEMHTSEGSFEERTPPGSVQLLTPSTHPESTQPSVLPDQLKSETDMAIDSTTVEKEVAEVPVDAVVYEEAQKEDPLKSFLPPPLTTKCSDELQEKINRFLAYKKAGKSFNADLRNRKDYRNPDFLQHAVRYQDIDQIGTCLSKNVFDPHGYDRSDYFDEIEADMKREMERKEQERKKTPKVDFVSGGTQPGTVAPVLKTNAQIPGISTSGLQSVSAIADTTREIKQNKKTKWDKIDGDVKNPLQSSSHDNLSAASVHAAHLSAANAGTGYTAFAQQKRREAEERMSGDRKFDRRS